MPWVCPEKTRKGQPPTPPTSPQTKLYHLRSSHAHTQQGPEHKHRPVVHNDYLVYRLTTTSSYTVVSRTAHRQGHSPTVLLGQDSTTHTSPMRFLCFQTHTPTSDIPPNTYYRSPRTSNTHTATIRLHVLIHMYTSQTPMDTHRQIFPTLEHTDAPNTTHGATSPEDNRPARTLHLCGCQLHMYFSPHPQCGHTISSYLGPVETPRHSAKKQRGTLPTPPYHRNTTWSFMHLVIDTQTSRHT